MTKRNISPERKAQFLANRNAYFSSMSPEAKKEFYAKIVKSRRDNLAKKKRAKQRAEAKMSQIDHEAVKEVIEKVLGVKRVPIKSKPDVRSEVSEFADKMEQKLKKRDGYGGWRHLPLEYLLKKLSGEMNELMTSIQYESAEEVMSECVDVANYAMFLWDVMRHKDPRNVKTLIRRSKESGR